MRPTTNYRTKYSENIYDRNWGKNNGMFITNLVRASVYNHFELVKQGFSPSAHFDVVNKHALIGITIDDKIYFAHEINLYNKVKYKAKHATDEIVKYLKSLNIINQHNYKAAITSIYILVSEVNNPNRSKNCLEVFPSGAINFLSEGFTKQPSSTLYSYDYYRSVLIDNVVYVDAQLH